MRPCPTCGHEVPDGRFCVRCGSPLETALGRARRRRAFAAAPAQRRWVPWLISSLYPQLPRHSERQFRAAVLAGGGLVVLCAALRWFAVGLMAAALLLPLITLLYFYEVDIYRDDPRRAALGTMVWGAACGAGVGLAARTLSGAGAASLVDRGAASQVLLLGLALPLTGVALMLLGPLALLRVAGYDDALDGAQFGAATAVAFSAAQAIVVGVGVLSGGLRQTGAPLPWIERLLALGVAAPVLAMCALGFTGAALWVRVRAPVADRGALGPLGRPVPAVAVAGVLVVAGALGEMFLPSGGWLGWLVALDLGGLVLLRGALHVGLLEESGETPIGPEIRCPNCGAATARHTFCGACGIALAALPAGGTHGGRLGHGRRRLAAAAALLALSAGVAWAVAALAAAPPRTPPCRRFHPCGSPPIPHALLVLPGYTAWQSSGLGYALRYAGSEWTVTSQSSTDLVLRSSDGSAQLVLHGIAGSGASLAALLDGTEDGLGGQLLGLARDTDRDDQVLGPNIGFVAGAQRVLRGARSTPQGPSTPESVTVLVARRGTLALVASVLTPGNDPGEQSTIFGRADDVLNSVRWP